MEKDVQAMVPGAMAALLAAVATGEERAEAAWVGEAEAALAEAMAEPSAATGHSWDSRSPRIPGQHKRRELAGMW